MAQNTIDGKLSGDLAHELFVSSLPSPLIDLLEAWKDGKQAGGTRYVLSAIRAYEHMRICHDGPRDGTYRPVASRIARLNKLKQAR